MSDFSAKIQVDAFAAKRSLAESVFRAAYTSSVVFRLPIRYIIFATRESVIATIREVDVELADALEGDPTMDSPDALVGAALRAWGCLPEGLDEIDPSEALDGLSAEAEVGDLDVHE